MVAGSTAMTRPTHGGSSTANCNTFSPDDTATAAALNGAAKQPAAFFTTWRVRALRQTAAVPEDPKAPYARTNHSCLSLQFPCQFADTS